MNRIGIRVTAALLGINILAYSALAYLSGSILEIDRLWMLKFGLYNQAFFEGVYWQLLTNLFVHFDLPHYWPGKKCGGRDSHMKLLGSKIRGINGTNWDLFVY